MTEHFQNILPQPFPTVLGKVSKIATISIGKRENGDPYGKALIAAFQRLNPEIPQPSALCPSMGYGAFTQPLKG